MPEAQAKAEKKPNYSVPAVRTAFRILQLLSRKKYNVSTLTEIARVLELNPTSCFRILKELTELSIVRYDDRKKTYSLGPYLVVLGERAKESLDYISLCLPFMEKLAQEVGMTTVLVNRVGDDRLTFVSKVEKDDFGIRVSIGRHFYIADGAYGKCFLAQMDKEDREYYLSRSKEYASLSPDERKRVLAELDRVRERGYAVSYEGLFKGIIGVAAPIYMEANKLEMCLTAIGLTVDYTEEELETKVGPLVKRYADSITEKLTRI